MDKRVKKKYGNNGREIIERKVFQRIPSFKGNYGIA